MTKATKPRICLLPHLTGIGGMASFQNKLAQGLAARKVEVVNDLRDKPYAAILVIGGLRDLPGLWRERRRGTRIVQRLNGMNWLHRLRRTGTRHFLRAEYGNAILAIIRSRLAHAIVYQSRFAQAWWERERGSTQSPSSIILNGVALDRYTPDGPHSRPADKWRILLVEGRLGGGYEIGLETANGMMERLRDLHEYPMEMVVVGSIDSLLQEYWQSRSPVPVAYLGQIPPAQIPEIDRSAHILYSADIHAACPNSVVEALACGLPVVSFDTGALAELVTGNSGRVVPYGGDAWKLDPPDLDGLASAAFEVLQNQTAFRLAARARAEAGLGLETMVDAYLEVLLPGGV
jgi:glycosyltransferase involved in cell wall biosynthesis